MDLIANLPKPEAFSAGEQYAVGDKLRLTLAIKHDVNAVFGSRERFGSAEVEYNIDYPKSVAAKESFSKQASTFIGVQSVDFIHQQLQELRPRTAYSVEHVTNGKFDFRAVLFTLGEAAMAGSAMLPYTYPARHAGFKTISTGWMVPDVGDVTLGPNLAQNTNQFVTLLALLGQAGVLNATILSDYVPGTTGDLLSGRTLGKFALRVALNILNSAQECLCFGAHYKAFLSGMLSVATVNAHSDEGGWIRKMLVAPTYPRSTGIIAGMGREFISFPLQEDIPKESIYRTLTGLLLGGLALIHPADHLAHGKTSVYERTEAPTNRISDYGTLASDVGDVMIKWSDLLCDLFGQHHDATSDVGAHYAFLRDPPTDRHMQGEFVVPFFYIEPCPLLTMDIAGYFKPADLSKVVKLPLFKAENVHHNSPYLDGKGRMARGSSVWVDRAGTTFREEGASYIFSTRYSPDDGLSQFRAVEGIDGAPREPFSFVDDTAVDLASMRWITPHNPFPNPVEGMTLDTTTLHYATRSVKYDPTPDDFLRGTVESRLSAFYLKSESSSGKTVTHKMVPPHVKRFLKTTNEDYAAVQSLKIVSLRPRVAMAQPPAIDKETDEAGEKATAAETIHPDAPDPESEAAVAQPSDTGVRPVMPTVRTAGREGAHESGGSD